jgi:phosphatidylglycerol:prolipoprotein diacylglycerol transferase
MTTGKYTIGAGNLLAKKAPVRECVIDNITMSSEDYSISLVYLTVMFPILFTLGPITFYTSTFFMMVAFLVSSYVFWKKGREEYYAEDELMDAYLVAMFWGLFWSRVGYVVFHFEQFGIQPLRWLDVFNSPGFFPVVGIFAAAATLYRFAQRQKWDEFEILDFGVLALSLLTAILWLGNFFAGAELGTTTQLPWGVVFPNVFDRRHPVQLYGFILYVLLFVYLFWAESRYRMFEWYRAKKDSAQSGFLFAMFCIFTGLIGLVLWIFTSSKVIFFNVPVEPIIRVALVIYGCVTLFRRSGRTIGFKKAK